MVQQLLPRVKPVLTARDITAPRGRLRDIWQDLRTRGNCCRSPLVITRLHNTCLTQGWDLDREDPRANLSHVDGQELHTPITICQDPQVVGHVLNALLIYKLGCCT
eukprot:2706928-Pyramimonas_sp.AAC.1